MSDTLAAARQQIAEMAAESFKDHVITPEGEGRWRCKRPGTGMYSFRVVTLPGAVVVYGDVGDALLKVSYYTTADIVAWLRGSYAQWGYVAGKLLFREALTEFYPGDALQFAAECAAAYAADDTSQAAVRNRDFAADVQALHARSELNEHEWHEVVEEYGLDCDAHAVGTGWSSHVFWTCEALACFVRLHDAAWAAAAADLTVQADKNV
jgi:hypothetical protein